MEPHVKIDDNAGGEISGGRFQSCGAWAHSGRCVMLNELCLGCGEGEKVTKQTMIDGLIHGTCQHLSLTCLLLVYCCCSVRLQVYVL